MYILATIAGKAFNTETDIAERAGALLALGGFANTGDQCKKLSESWRMFSCFPHKSSQNVLKILFPGDQFGLFGCVSKLDIQEFSTKNDNFQELLGFLIL